MTTSRLTTNGRVTLPKSIREHLGLRAGDRIEFRITPAGQVVVEAETIDLRDLRGVLKSEHTTVSIEKMKKTTRRAATRRCTLSAQA